MILQSSVYMHGQNTTARTASKRCSCPTFFTDSQKCGHISPTLFPLHWLPVHLRIELKNFFSFGLWRSCKAWHRSHLAELLSHHAPGCGLSSSEKARLVIPRFWLVKSKDDRASAVRTPDLWNSSLDEPRLQHFLPPFKWSLQTSFYHMFLVFFVCSVCLPLSF